MHPAGGLSTMCVDVSELLRLAKLDAAAEQANAASVGPSPPTKQDTSRQLQAANVRLVRGKAPGRGDRNGEGVRGGVLLGGDPRYSSNRLPPVSPADPAVLEEVLRHPEAVLKSGGRRYSDSHASTPVGGRNPTTPRFKVKPPPPPAHLASRRRPMTDPIHEPEPEPAKPVTFEVFTATKLAALEEEAAREAAVQHLAECAARELDGLLGNLRDQNSAASERSNSAIQSHSPRPGAGGDPTSPQADTSGDADDRAAAAEKVTAWLYSSAALRSSFLERQVAAATKATPPSEALIAPTGPFSLQARWQPPTLARQLEPSAAQRRQLMYSAVQRGTQIDANTYRVRRARERAQQLTSCPSAGRQYAKAMQEDPHPPGAGQNNGASRPFTGAADMDPYPPAIPGLFRRNVENAPTRRPKRR